MLAPLVATALAATFGMQLEAGPGHFVSAPQRDYFGWGGALSLRGDLTVLGPLAVQLSGTFINVANVAPFLTGPGRVVQAGAGAKLRLFDDLFWADAQLLLVGTGPYTRFGWELGAGVAFSLLELFRLGPYVRVEHIVQPDSSEVDGSDAVYLHLGLAVSVTLKTPAARPPPPPPPPLPPVPPPSPAVEAPAPLPPPALPVPTVTVAKSSDVDEDGIPDSRDACPLDAELFNGSADSDGCPDPEKGPALITLSATELEVLPALRFEKGTRLDAASAVVAGTLARVLALHPELKRVRLMLSDATAELAQRRAEALLRVLVEAGLPAERLEAKGAAGKTGRLEIEILER